MNCHAFQLGESSRKAKLFLKPRSCSYLGLTISSTRAAPTDGALLAELADPAGFARGPVPIGPYTIGVTNLLPGNVPLKFAEVEVRPTKRLCMGKVQE